MTARPDPALFDYVARDAKGGRRKGRLPAASESEVARRLREDGLYPISVAAAAPPRARLSFGVTASDGPLTRKEQAELLSRLAKLASAQVPLDRALGLMARGGGRIPGAAGRMRGRMREGGTFLGALNAEAGIDDPATLALIRGSELSGDLHAALAAASGIMERRLAAIRKMVTALLYPMLLLVVALGALGLILGVIIPQFRPLVAERMDMVPALGRAVFALSSVLSSSGPLLAGGTLVGGFLAWLAHRRGRLMPGLRRVCGRLPGIRNVTAQAQRTVALDVLAALLKRDVVLSEALAVVVETAPEGPLRDGLGRASGAVSGGVPLSDALADEAGISAEAIEMIRIGEETGELAAMIDRAAREMRDRSDRATERLLALFQPALIIIVGLLVGVCLYALFSAITAVNSIAF